MLTTRRLTSHAQNSLTSHDERCTSNSSTLHVTWLSNLVQIASVINRRWKFAVAHAGKKLCNFCMMTWVSSIIGIIRRLIFGAISNCCKQTSFVLELNRNNERAEIGSFMKHNFCLHAHHVHEFGIYRWNVRVWRRIVSGTWVRDPQTFFFCHFFSGWNVFCMVLGTWYLVCDKRTRSAAD